jgi:hypothetical protein
MGNEINVNNNLNEIEEINFGHFQIFADDLKNNLLEPLNKLEEKISNDLNEIDNFINENDFNEEKNIENEENENINVKYAESKKKIREFINKINFDYDDSEKFINDFSKEIIHANNSREILFKILMN